MQICYLTSYNTKLIMISKIWKAKLVNILLSAVFLIGLLPFSDHSLSMHSMQMDAKHSVVSLQQEKIADNSMASCCEAIGSLLLACDFMVFQPACIVPDRESERILYLAQIFQAIFLQSPAPPPKA